VRENPTRELGGEYDQSKEEGEAQRLLCHPMCMVVTCVTHANTSFSDCTLESAGSCACDRPTLNN
jgi:hypothetical protein